MVESKDGPKTAATDRDDEVAAIRLSTAGVRRRTAMFASAASRAFANIGADQAAAQFGQASADSADAARAIIKDENTKK